MPAWIRDELVNLVAAISSVLDVNGERAFTLSDAHEDLPHILPEDEGNR
ncbi:hypothetical protein [Nonomuraea sp. NPDC023979]